MRWLRYAGSRIKYAGVRTSVLLGNKVWHAEFIRIYGCVWPSNRGWSAYFERHLPGQVEDVELGWFTTERAARAAVCAALRDPANWPREASTPLNFRPLRARAS